MNFDRRTLRTVAAGLTLVGALLASTQASANSLAYAVATDNWTFSGTTQVDVESMQSNVFTKPAGQRLIVTFSAECAVNAPANNTSAWLDVDIVLLNATTGAVVYTAAPTVGSADAFCTSNGVAGFQHWGTYSVQALIPYNFAAGSYKAAVKARLNNGATGGWLGERMLSVMQ